MPATARARCGSGNPGASSCHGSAAATASDASAWTARRTGGRTPRQSSANETAVTAAQAASHDRAARRPEAGTAAPPAEILPRSRFRRRAIPDDRAASGRSDSPAATAAAARQQHQSAAAESAAAMTGASQGEYAKTSSARADPAPGRRCRGAMRDGIRRSACSNLENPSKSMTGARPSPPTAGERQVFVG